LFEVPKAQSSKEIKLGLAFKDCNECPEMVMIPAGTFMMGSPPASATDPFSNEKTLKKLVGAKKNLKTVFKFNHL
jgi:formylglycine-generating enzyme required for sulfatase activity